LSTDLIARVRRFGERHSLWANGMRVVAAVSGGSDSVALAFLLRELAARGQVVLAGIAHLHHHIRGGDADADAHFARVLAERLGVPVIVGNADVPAEARAHSVSLEVAGRHARQKFYRDAMASVTAERVATAHTLDDQAETVMLRLLRGAGTAGLAAMAARRDHIIRPLLDTTRDELRHYLREIGEPWREDVTNEDRSIPRNFVRHDVMPRLRELNAQADAALARAAEILRCDDEFLERVANAAFVRCVEVEDAGEVRVRIDVAEFAKLPLAIARRVARYVLETVSGSRTYGLEEIDEFCRAVSGGTGWAHPDVAVELCDANAVLIKRGVRGVHGVHAPSVDPIELRLDVPGTVEAPRGAWTVSAQGPINTPEAFDWNATRVMVDASEVGSPLIVRYRRPGDRLQPLGAPGRRKVQDVLVDRKVPRDDRDLIPIVTTQKGDIVWIAGQVLADPFRVTPLTRSVVVLTLRR
jgi:tRNA(Ile)-lysidine synthase